VPSVSTRELHDDASYVLEVSVKFARSGRCRSGWEGLAVLVWVSVLCWVLGLLGLSFLCGAGLIAASATPGSYRTLVPPWDLPRDPWRR
jgi:hypothetical protein